MKKITVKEAKKINEKNGLETWEGDECRTYWLANDNETETYGPFYSEKERERFMKG